MLLAWSSGKDSAWALHLLRREGVAVVALQTTLDATSDRVTLHGVRRELVAAQAAATGLPLLTVPVPRPCGAAEYAAALRASLDDAVRDHAVTHVAFGDLFLEEVRRYRETRLAETGLTALFPLWGRPTAGLAREMVAGGLRAVLTCVDPARLDPAHAGRAFDGELLDALPATVDACGERGEFHSFVHAGPMFSGPIAVTVGDAVRRDGLVFVDLVG